MNININVHSIKSATAIDHLSFSMVTLETKNGGEITLFFDRNKGQKVADAINAAIAEPEEVKAA